MNPTLLKIAQFIARRPKDSTIRAMNIITGAIVMGLLWWSQNRSTIEIPFMAALSPASEKKVQYGLIIIGIFPLLRGILPWCLVKHNTLRILQGLFGFALILIGGPMMQPIVKNIIAPTTTATGGFQITTQTAPIVEMTWTPGSILILIGIFWLLVGLTGKGTTEKCIRFGEVVKKIRV